MSRVGSNVLYDCYYKCGDAYKRSPDGGETWIKINPIVLENHAINQIEIIETGMHSQTRVYAWVWFDGNREFRCAVSDDYGQTIYLLSEEIKAIVESRSSPKIMVWSYRIWIGYPRGWRINLGIDGWKRGIYKANLQKSGSRLHPILEAIHR